MSTSASVLKSAGLLLGLQLLQRGLGLISTLILARLLTPAQFGIVALITIALQFFELLAETGNQQYIVQKAELSADDLNTAWSLDVLLKGVLALVIIACAPLVARYFANPQLTLALSIACLALPLRAFKSPGLMRLARDINYRPLFRITLWQKVITFTVVISLALAYHSYWAIITGNLVSAAVMAIGSYRVDSHRPRWTLVHLRQQWHFSQWLLLRGVVGFTRSQIDSLMVSKFFGTTPLGGYNLVREISLLPALSAIIPMSEPLLAAIAQARTDAQQLAYRVRFSMAVLVSFLTPVTVFIMAYPKLIVSVLLGSQWLPYAQLLRPFGLFFFTFCLFALVSDAAIALGRVQRLFWFDVVSTLIIIAVLLITGTHSLGAMAWSRGILAVITTLALLVILWRWTRFGFALTSWLCVPAILGSLAALVPLEFIPTQGMPAVALFLIKGTLFVLMALGLTLLLGRLLLKRQEEWRQAMALIAQLKRRGK